MGNPSVDSLCLSRCSMYACSSHFASADFACHTNCSIKLPSQLVQSSSDGEVAKIQGFDFAEWLKSTVIEKDFVVMKMDVEGTELDLIPRLFKTGPICLIDEPFLECHYNRWQRCCPHERSSKYEKTNVQCLDLFTSPGQSGVLVHHWW